MGVPQPAVGPGEKGHPGRGNSRPQSSELRPPGVEEGSLLAWCIYCTLKFLGLFRVECGLDLVPLNNSEESEAEKESPLLQGYLVMIVLVP